MNEVEWLQLQEHGPGQFIDVVSCYRKSRTGKWQRRTLKEIVEAVAQSLSAMANADGGVVFLGAEAEGEIPGSFFDEKMRQLLFRDLEKATVPPLQFEAPHEAKEGQVLPITVKPSPLLHLLKNGKSYLRVGSQNVPVSRERMASLKEAKVETWHEREILPRSSLEDLDGNLVSEFIRLSGAQGGLESILHRPYGLIEYRQGQPVLTRAAAYLFGKDPLRWHPRPGVDFVRFEGKKEGMGGEHNVAERIRIEAPILGLIEKVESVIGGRIKERVVLQDLFFREKFEYPSFAWKEALLNAIAHRDYRLEGSAIEVWMFDDCLEVRSPGNLPGPVKRQQLMRQEKIHYSRNPLITRILIDAGIMRALGEGLPKIFREMDLHGLNPPELSEEGNFFCLALRNTPIYDEGTRDWLQKFSGQPLNPRQKHILAYAKVHGMMFSSSDYQKFGVDRDTAYMEIKDLVRQGIVQPLKKHGKAYRVLTGESQAAALPGLSWVTEALEKKGFFTLQDVKQPESISRSKALEMMRGLAERGYFTVSGKGRGIKYHPTERLPLPAADKNQGAENPNR
jgi:ATP-dependent DNA helicase RecG